MPNKSEPGRRGVNLGVIENKTSTGMGSENLSNEEKENTGEASVHDGRGRCGQRTEVYSRVVGYYRPVQQWNKGKQQEFKDRRTFEPGETLPPKRETITPAGETKG